MPALLRLGVTALLVVLLPFQALTAAFLDLGGAAHFHIESDHHAHADEPHGHHHGHLEHHPHAHDDASVVGVEDDPAEDARTGWSSTLCAAMLVGGLVHALPPLKAALAASSGARLRTRFIDTPDRPPAPSLR